MKKGIRIALGIFAVLLCIGAATLWGAMYYLPNTFNETTDEQVVVIEEKQTGAEIAQMLYEKGLIRSPELFRLALRISGNGAKLQTGYYQIPNKVNQTELIELLQKGHVKTVRVTIPEGYTIGEIAIALEKDRLVTAKEFLDVSKNYVPYQYMYGPKPVTYRVEGFLFPSTYDIPVDASAKDIIDLMAREMNSQLTPDIRKQLDDENMTIFEFITLASLVEKEALFDKDREPIAAVFKKRLKLGMPIQSDASIQYILGYPKAHVTIEDTQLQSPYNTYIINGLPPGPIANPGKKSLEAVLNAGDTEYLYFVADKEGHNHFTKTYEEHLKVVESIYGN